MASVGGLARVARSQAHRTECTGLTRAYSDRNADKRTLEQRVLEWAPRPREVGFEDSIRECG